MSAFAIYRLPHADQSFFVRQTEGEPEELLSCAELNGREGFVVAPFEVTPEQPILLIRGDESFLWKEESFLWKEESLLWKKESLSTFHFPLSSMNTYAIDFANFHAQLEAGIFRKIVLARCATEHLPQGMTPLNLYAEACKRYPRMFVSLVYTEKSGLWLTATPEILLEGSGNSWRTIALAGTMKLEGEQLNGEGESLTWGTKDIQEQRYVATYITECLERFTSDFVEDGPRTVRAANLVHLRSDFTFSLPDDQHVGDLLQALHPTPAVCGLPKREAFRFITQNECTPRRYYSGFMGPLSLRDSTHLYVSLRCMNIAADQCRLYAGGGLLKDSRMEQEWKETEAKMETMRGLLGIKS